jgi:hypothetical protein
MKNKRLLEYFEGTPDNVYDTVTKTDWGWHSKIATSFGYFPISLDNEYLFMTGSTTHLMIAAQAAKKLMGKAISHIKDTYISWIERQCYEKSYCRGRIWNTHTDKYPSFMAFWYLPSSRMLRKIVNELGIDPMKYLLVVEDSQSAFEENPTVAEYISSNMDGDDGYDEMNEEFKIDPKVRDIIKRYNETEKSWQVQKEKEGWKTLAQRNATLYQEGKEHKKENNIIIMKNRNHQEEFSNYINIMSEALKKGDYKAYEYVNDMLNEAIEESKHEDELMEEMNTTNFGVLNHIFESELPTLIKSNKKAVRNVIKTIKEDKNLRSQFNFYNVIKEQYNENHAKIIGSKTVLADLTKIVCEDIDVKTVKASNKKLRNVMIESGIKPSEFVDEESMKLYENGDVILTTKRTTNNMIPLVESYDAVCKWMDAHKSDKINEGKTPDDLIEEFEEKLKNNLNESELSFVQQITDFRTPIAEQRKEKLFNKFKNECIDKINDMLKEDSENVELKGLSNQINEMTFNKETIVKDIAKLLEIRDILMDD